MFMFLKKVLVEVEVFCAFAAESRFLFQLGSDDRYVKVSSRVSL